MPPPVEASCHCGRNVIVLASPPEEVTSCNCSICRRYGVLWAYYPGGDVDLGRMVETGTYAWDDRAIAFHRCTTCGCVTCWLPTNGSRDRIGVNARLLALEVTAAARVRHLDGAVTERYLDE